MFHPFGQISISISIILPGFDKDWKRRGSMEFFFASNLRNSWIIIRFFFYFDRTLTSHLFLSFYTKTRTLPFESSTNFNLKLFYNYWKNICTVILFLSKNRGFEIIYLFGEVVSLFLSEIRKFFHRVKQDTIRLLHFRFHYP